MKFWSLCFILIIMASLLGSGYAATGQQQLQLGEPGMLVVTAAQDTAYGYRWVEGPGEGRRSLIWDDGVVSVPAGHPVEGFGAFDLAIPCTDILGGVGFAGRLKMEDGQYRIDEPLLMTDGIVFFFANDGLLEVVASRVRYFPPEKKKEIVDPRSSFFMLGGLLILIAVLVRRSRKIIRKRIEPS